MTIDLSRLGKDHQPSKLERQLIYLRNAIGELQQLYMNIQLAVVGQQTQFEALLKHLGVTQEQLKEANKVIQEERAKEEAEKKESELEMPTQETLEAAKSLQA